MRVMFSCADPVLKWAVYDGCTGTRFTMLIRKIFVLRNSYVNRLFQIPRCDAQIECMTSRYPASVFQILNVDLGKN